jgi:hypothetical protein
MKQHSSLNHENYIRPGMATLIVKSCVVFAIFVGLYMTGLLDNILPQDGLSWVWIGSMVMVFFLAGIFLLLPYQNLVDREVMIFRQLMADLREGGEKSFQKVMTPTSYGAKDKTTQLYRLLASIHQIMSDKERKTKLDIDRLLFRMEQWHSLKTRPIHWMRSSLLTFGIIGTYVGIRLATGGADMMATGEPEAIFAFVIEMFKYLSLAILSTLVGLKLGTMFIGHVISRAERTMHFIVNDLSGAFHESGFITWVNDEDSKLTTATAVEETEEEAIAEEGVSA